MTSETLETQNLLPSTVEEAWEMYAQDLQAHQPRPLSPEFLQKIRLVFFMGARAAFGLLYDAGTEDNEDLGTARVEKIFNELARFTGEAPSQENPHAH